MNIPLVISNLKRSIDKDNPENIRMNVVLDVLSELHKEVSGIDPAAKSHSTEILISCMFCKHPTAEVMRGSEHGFYIECRCGARTGTYTTSQIAINKWNNAYLHK